jgi:general secretion pathway protein L
MAEQIIARLLNQEDECVQWLVMNNAICSEPQQGTLQDLANSAKKTSVTLLLPASAVLLLAVDLPVKSANQINKALPFALEDLLADDVETYHLAWYRPPKEKVTVAAISHEKFQDYLLRFQELGIELSSVYPETLCLPYQERSCAILVDGQTIVLRTGQWLGGGVDLEFLPVWVDKLFSENPHLESLQIWSAEAQVESLPQLPINIIHNELNSPLQLFQPEAEKLNGGLNLLSGRYSPKGTTDLQWRKWLPAVAIFLLAALLQTGVLLKSYWSQKAELAALETQTLVLFKQAFPDVKRIVNIKVQAEQQLQDLKKQGSGNGSRFMRLLYESGLALSANPGFVVRQLDFVNKILLLQLTAPDINQLEQFKQQIESGNQLSVKILSAETAQNALEAHLEISEK